MRSSRRCSRSRRVGRDADAARADRRGLSGARSSGAPGGRPAAHPAGARAARDLERAGADVRGVEGHRVAAAAPARVRGRQGRSCRPAGAAGSGRARACSDRRATRWPRTSSRTWRTSGRRSPASRRPASALRCRPSPTPGRCSCSGTDRGVPSRPCSPRRCSRRVRGCAWCPRRGRPSPSTSSIWRSATWSSWSTCGAAPPRPRRRSPRSPRRRPRCCCSRIPPSRTTARRDGASTCRSAARPPSTRTRRSPRSSACSPARCSSGSATPGADRVTAIDRRYRELGELVPSRRSS